MTATGGRQGRPVIGLTTYREQAAWSVWNMSADLLPAVYTRSVEAAGGVVAAEPEPSGAPAETSAGSSVRRTVVPEWADLETDPTAALMAWEEHAQQLALGAKHAAEDGISKQA